MGLRTHGKIRFSADKTTYIEEDAGTVRMVVNGTTVWEGTSAGLSTLLMPRAAQKYVMKAGSKVGGTSGWVVAAADNVHLITCPASQTGAKLIIPVSGLKVGWTITAFHLIGQIESAGNGVTVDVDLRKQTAAAADVADASLGTITQLSVTADAIMSASNTRKELATPEVIAADETFYAIVTATTGASTDIALQGMAIEVTET